jgi:acyl-CoA thioesterase-2
VRTEIPPIGPPGPPGTDHSASATVDPVSESERPTDFASLLTLAPAGEDAFSATLHDYGDGRGFGGDLLGRALLAARRTADPARRLCSFHALFLRPGPAGQPVQIEVERVKEGRRISQRRARLGVGGKAICELVATFAAASAGPSYQEPSAPEVPAPDALPSDVEVARAEGMEWRPGEVEWRWVERGWYATEPGESSLWRAWARPRRPMPDDPGLHEAALAYLSDFGSHWSVVRRLGDAFDFERFASLDQGLWVHRPVRWDDWWLVVNHSDVALDGHTFTRRQIFDAQGRLLASGSQEGLHPSPT